MNATLASKKINELGRVLTPYKPFLVKSVISGILLSCFAIPGPWLTKILIDSVTETSDFNLLYFIIITIFFITVFQSVLTFIREFFMTNVSMRMAGDIQMLFFSHLQKLSFRFFSLHETGEITARFSDISNSLNNSMAIINTVAINLVQITIFPIVLFYVSWRLALIALIVLPLEILLYLIFNRTIQKYTKKTTEKSAEVNARVVESLEGIKTVQALNIQKSVIHTISERIFDVLNVQSKLMAYHQTSILAQNFLKAFGTFLYTLFGWQYILNGEITLGAFLAFVSYIGFFYGPILQIMEMNQQIQTVFVHTHRFLNIFDIEPEVKDNASSIDHAGPLRGHIKIDNLCFSYDESNPVLRNISLNIEPGCCLAVVGKSGVGKTTLVNLIARFFNPDEGSILIDGHNIKSYSLDYLRDNIGYVTQEPYLFNGTIKENIVFGNESFAHNLKQAADTAMVTEFVEKLPDSLNTMVGQRGLKLSQGQKQRIAVARVLLKDTPILILDEPTSALDIESEEKFQKAMDNIYGKKTTIVIAHRLSTIRKADMICVMENGEIVESGSHNELIDNQGLYYEMYQKMNKVC